MRLWPLHVFCHLCIARDSVFKGQNYRRKGFTGTIGDWAKIPLGVNIHARKEDVGIPDLQGVLTTVGCA